jgi:hypothetical protein
MRWRAMIATIIPAVKKVQISDRLTSWIEIKSPSVLLTPFSIRDTTDCERVQHVLSRKLIIPNGGRIRAETVVTFKNDATEIRVHEQLKAISLIPDPIGRNGLAVDSTK